MLSTIFTFYIYQFCYKLQEFIDRQLNKIINTSRNYKQVLIFSQLITHQNIRIKLFS